MKSNVLYYAKKVLGFMIARLLYRPVLKLVIILGFWRYPSGYDPDRIFSQDFGFKKILGSMYRAYKEAKPIVRPEKGSRLEAYFAEKRRQIDRPLLPEGFQDARCVTISAVGDLMNARGLENSMGKFYAKVAELIFDADISIANLESTLTRSTVANTGFQINAKPEQFNTFKGHKNKQYTVFSTANNHILDRGLEGFNTTHDQLESGGYFYVGTNRSLDAQKKGLILTSNGVKFGLVAATYSVNNNPFPNRKDYLVNVIPFHRFQGKVDVSLLEEQIAYCRSEECDFIILSLHWGMEFEFFPRQDQVDIAHHLIDYGADTIISHHTHTIQPYEIYQTRRDPHRKAPIFYGLGNLSSLWSKPCFALSLIASIDVVKGRVNESIKTLAAHVNVTPVLQMEYDCNGRPYLQIEKLRSLIKSAGGDSRSEYFRQAGKYADLVLGRSWRN